MRWLTFREKKNLEREKLQVSLLENHKWLGSFYWNNFYYS